MIRTILKPDTNTLVLDLPDDLVGKTIEVPAFEIDGGYIIRGIYSRG